MQIGACYVRVSVISTLHLEHFSLRVKGESCPHIRHESIWWGGGIRHMAPFIRH